MAVTGTRSPAPFDPFDHAYQGWDRYTVLEHLLARDPPVAIDPLGRIWVFRYEDVFEALVRSEGLEAQETSVALTLGFKEGCPFHTWQQHQLIGQNPPRHTRLRKAHSYFGKHQLKPLVPYVRAACNALLDGFPDDGVVEFSYEFAFKLPVGVIMRILHLPLEDEELIREWSPRALPAGAGPDVVAATDKANAHLRAYVEGVMEARRKRPLQDDIIGDLLALERRAELSHDEIWANVQALIIAGHETTTSALSLGLYTLLHHREQLDELRADASLIQNAVHEILRYEPPLDQTTRRVHTRFALYGTTLEPGSLLNVSLAASNRDHRKFPEANRFDIHRPNALAHLTFGGGIHRCLGASLAALELQIALETLLQRLETIEFAGEPKLAAGRIFRTFESLPIRVTRRQ
jgi:cytochrome P450